MKKILLNDIIKINNYKRYVYTTKSLLKMIEKENINENFKWPDIKILKNI